MNNFNYNNFNISCENCGNGTFRKYHIIVEENDKHDVILFLQNLKTYIHEILTRQLDDRRGIKWFLCLQEKYNKENAEGEIISTSP